MVFTSAAAKRASRKPAPAIAKTGRMSETSMESSSRMSGVPSGSRLRARRRVKPPIVTRYAKLPPRGCERIAGAAGCLQMRRHRGFAFIGIAVFTLSAAWAFRLPFREYPGVEYRVGDVALPPDWQERTEWVFARLMYPPSRYGRGGFRFRGGDWTEGFSIWTQDYPRADRHFAPALRRLTRIHVRSVEQPINLDDGDVYDWPWLYAVQTGSWKLTDRQTSALREFLLRGGFLMCDDFWGDAEWQTFMETMSRVLPGRPRRDRGHWPRGSLRGGPGSLPLRPAALGFSPQGPHERATVLPHGRRCRSRA